MNELQAIAKINEEIKQIVSLAEDISLTATNAMLVARQAGKQAIGFSVVARELRLFSENITTAMQTLSKLIYQQVVATAGKRHRQHSIMILTHITIAGGDLAQVRIAPACQAVQTDIDKTQQFIASLLYTLQLTIKRTGKRCASGLIIARSAGIEASHGGNMTPVLRQVAQEIEGVVSNLATQVKKLETQLIKMNS